MNPQPFSPIQAQTVDSSSSITAQISGECTEPENRNLCFAPVEINYNISIPVVVTEELVDECVPATGNPNLQKLLEQTTTCQLRFIEDDADLKHAESSGKCLSFRK